MIPLMERALQPSHLHGCGMYIKHDIPRFVRFATEVWRVPNDPFDQEAVALEGTGEQKNF